MEQVGHCALCWAPIYANDKYVVDSDGTMFCTGSCEDEAKS